MSNAEFALQTGYPVIIVGRCSLGTINQTLLSLHYAQYIGLDVKGFVLSHTSPPEDDSSSLSNPQEIVARTNVPLLGVVPHLQEMKEWEERIKNLNLEERTRFLSADIALKFAQLKKHALIEKEDSDTIDFTKIAKVCL